MSYSVNQIFEKSYPPEAAEYCNQNGFKLTELEPENNIRRFQIQLAPELSLSEKAMLIRHERNALLRKTDFTQISDAPLSQEDKEKYRAYRAYLRAIPENSEFPNIAVMTFEDWKNK